MCSDWLHGANSRRIFFSKTGARVPRDQNAIRRAGEVYGFLGLHPSVEYNNIRDWRPLRSSSARLLIWKAAIRIAAKDAPGGRQASMTKTPQISALFL
jgi:hypothetical protein